MPGPGPGGSVAPYSEGRVRGEITTEQEGGRGAGPGYYIMIVRVRVLQIFDQEYFITFKQNIKKIDCYWCH